ncbi:MAG: ABC transporter permease [Phycisphaerae bacterium]
MSIGKWLDRTSVLKVAAAWLLVIGAWEGAYRVVGWKPWVFPAPSHVLDATLSLLHVRTAFGDAVGPGWPWPADAPPPTRAGSWLSSPLPGAIAISALRLAVGFVSALALGGALGLAMWRYRFVDAFFGPLFLGFQTLPSVCWVPLAILVLGINEAAILFVLLMGSFFAVALALRDGLRQIPPVYKNAGMMLGARRWRLYWHVLLPAGMPALAGSLRSGFSFAWRSLMGAELIFMLQRRGLGFLLNAGREFADIAQVVAIMLLMVLIGMLVDQVLFARIERRIRTRFGLA